MGGGGGGGNKFSSVRYSQDSLSTPRVYKWVPANLLSGVALR